MKATVIVSGMILFILASYLWGTLCSTLFEPDVSMILSMVGGGLIGWFGMGLVLSKARSLP